METVRAATRKKRGIQYVLLILTLAFIWGHSLMPVSTSSAESGQVLEWLRPMLELFVGRGSATDHLVRKLAHFTEFAALGFQIFLLPRGARNPLARRWLCTLNLGLIAAFLDESIQMLSGRGDQIIDVWLDTGGIGFGSLAAVLLVLAYRKGGKAPET